MAAVIEAQRVRAAADPIAHHRFSSPQARELVTTVCAGREGYIRSGNRAGKSVAGALLGVAFARGIRRIDGRTINEANPHHEGYIADPQWITLPVLPTPNVGIIAVENRNQAEPSTIAVYREMLGDWPHKIIKGGMGYTVEIRVKPDNAKSDDPDDWSRIHIFPSDGGASPKGIPANWVHADEPPTAEIWGELRMRLNAGHTLYRWITATPIHRAQWEWLRADYGTPAEWKHEIVLTVFDNQALTPKEKADQKEKAEADPEGLTEARLYGAYVNIDGANPFREWAPELREWMAYTREPNEIEVAVMAEPDARNPQGFELLRLRVYEWWKPEKGERYYVICDPSLGVDDPEHDPCGLLVVARRHPRVVARYNDFCGADPLGALAAILAERYNDALVDVDMTGGYGQPTLAALKRYRSARYSGGYGNINRSQQLDKGGVFRDVLGWTIDGEGKSELIEAVRLELQKARAGLPCVYIPSAGVVKCLQEATMDKNARLLKPRGVHYEDLICLGRALALLHSRPKVKEREIEREHGRRKPLTPKVVGPRW